MASRLPSTVDIVTGASQGIGRSIAEYVAYHRSRNILDKDAYKLVLVGRNERRGQQAASLIQKATGLEVLFESCDLSSYQQVQALQHKILFSGDEGSRVRIGILVNNAAECPQRQQFVDLPRKGQSKPDSVDKQFASNVLGYHFVMSAFQEYFERSHVVMVASNWAGDLDLKDLNFRHRSYDNDTAYRQSKQCDRILSALWAKRLDRGKAVVNACHPGDPCTTLSKDLGYNLYSSPPSRDMIERQTSIPFLCGFGDRKIETTGGWFDEGNTSNPSRCRFANMKNEVEELFEICESYCIP
jgi:NAD(P)-dependent dehydrogenase (short-subunit alcohol dehydrogenase family)